MKLPTNISHGFGKVFLGLLDKFQELDVGLETLGRGASQAGSQQADIHPASFVFFKIEVGGGLFFIFGIGHVTNLPCL